MTANFSPALAGFGPGSAFAGFPTPAARPPRRVASSGSFKDDSRSAPPHSFNGPTPIDHQQTPSLGSWESSDRERQHSTSSLHSHGERATGGAGAGNAGLTNGHAHPAGPAHQRSFSSILSPSLPATNEAPVQDPLAKPFVYSREFLLSLYDDDKASRRPIELARHEIATRDRGGKPWALSDWRDGEKELFATSIHPPTSRTANTTSSTRGSGMHRTDSTPASTTLDLSTLGQLPRERDRALASPSPASRSSSLTAGIGNSAENGRRARGTLGTMGASTGNGMGILGGVLGGIGGAKPLGTPGGGRREGSVGASPAGTKEVWQGGRWRRGGTAEEEDKQRPSAFGARRFPTDSVADSSPNDHDRAFAGDATPPDDVPANWDADASDEDVKPSLPTPPSSDGQRHSPPPTRAAYEPDHLAQHASSILGSLSLDTDATDDPLLSSQSRAQPPPGLPTPSLPRPESMWHYRDPSGQVQGPFAASMMQDWYRQNFFAGDLRVKRSQELDFESLDNLVRRAADPDTPFLSAQLQHVAALPPPPATPQNGNSWGGQFGGAVDGQRAFGGGSFYEPFGASSPGVYDPVRSQSQQSAFGFASPVQERRQPSGGLDPWGAPLPAANPAFASPAAWNEGNLFGGAYGQQRQQQQQQQQQQYQQPIQHQQSQHLDLGFGRHESNDLFGRQSRQSSIPASPYFDPSQLSATTNSDWRLPQQPQQQPPRAQQQVQQQQQQQAPIQTASIGQNSWASLISSAVPAPLDALPTSASIPSPIGPPAPSAMAQDLAQEPFAAPAALAWGSVKPSEPVVAAVPVPVVAAPLPTPEPTPAPLHALIAKAPATKQVQSVASTPSSAATTPTKQPAVAPWTNDAESAPSPSGPSLRQIQEVEARQAEIRKAAERQASARTQALAAVQAAQRAAAAEAETLPSSSTWAAPAKAVSPAPWSTSKAAVGGKTLKEIQEEEELRRKKAAALAAQNAVPAAGVRGYAGSIGQLAPAKAIPGAPWTTVGIKPPTTTSLPVARPIIPAGPLAVARPIPAFLPAKPMTLAPVAPRPVIPVAQPPPRPISRSAGTTYDADSPPPPSMEFMKWCREALKGLTVPMDEFIQMLLSFPLDASPDVLEIISDSVYANSSTLDGRRFANDYASRRKLDVAARYPSIVMSKTVAKIAGKPSSMAEALKSQPAVKAPEWSVKVAGGKKKKGGK